MNFEAEVKKPSINKKDSSTIIVTNFSHWNETCYSKELLEKMI